MLERLRCTLIRVSRKAFLLLGMRAVGKCLLVMLIPAALALFIVIPLGMRTKSAGVDVHIVTHRASFTLLSGWRSGQDVELLQSVAVKSVHIWIDSLEIPAQGVTQDRSKSAINARTILLRSRPHSSPWVEFKTETEVPLTNYPLVSHLQSTAGSTVEITAKDDKLYLKMTPRDRIQGEISLNGPASMIVNDFEVLGDGKPLAGLEEEQQPSFHLTDAADPVRFESNQKVELQLDLTGKANLLGAFSDFLRVKDLNFPLGNGETAIPIVDGSVAFRGIERTALDLKSSFLSIPGDNVMDIVTIGANSGALELTASGKVRSLKTGKVPGPDDEELPNLLDWLYHNQKLGIIFGVLAWISGTVFGAVKLVGELKK